MAFNTYLHISWEDSEGHEYFVGLNFIKRFNWVIFSTYAITLTRKLGPPFIHLFLNLFSVYGMKSTVDFWGCY